MIRVGEINWGAKIPVGPGQDVLCIYTNGTGNAIALAGFDAVAQDKQVEVSWTTLSELNTLGSNLMRSSNPTGDFTPANDTLILAKGNEFAGASYHFVDTNITPDQSYFYYLQEVTTQGDLVDYKDNLAASTEANTAYVRVAHAIPDAPQVDIYLDGQRQFPNIAFGQVSAYQAFSPTLTSTVHIMVKTADVTNSLIISETVPVMPGSFTIAAIPPTDLLVIDDNARTPVEGVAKFRIAHLGESDITITEIRWTRSNASGTLQLPGGSGAGSLNLGQVTAYLALEPGTYQFVIYYRNGAGGTGSLPLRMMMQTYKLAGNTAHTAFVMSGGKVTTTLDQGNFRLFLPLIMK